MKIVVITMIIYVSTLWFILNFFMPKDLDNIKKVDKDEKTK